MIQLDDVHGLWGGQAVTVTGAGRVTVKRVAPGFPAGQWEATRSHTKTLALFRLFMEDDFAALALPDHTPLPDEAHPQLTLINARGERHTVIKWARQADDRFERLSAAVRALAEQVVRED